MRKLALKDAFAFGRIIKKANIKDEISSMAKVMKNRKDEDINIEEVGLEFVITLISSFSDEKVELMFYELYASIKGVSVEDVSNLTYETLKNDITIIIKENDLKNFFKSVSSLM